MTTAPGNEMAIGMDDPVAAKAFLKHVQEGLVPEAMEELKGWGIFRGSGLAAMPSGDETGRFHWAYHALALAWLVRVRCPKDD